MRQREESRRRNDGGGTGNLKLEVLLFVLWLLFYLLDLLSGFFPLRATVTTSSVTSSSMLISFTSFW